MFNSKFTVSSICLGCMTLLSVEAFGQAAATQPTDNQPASTGSLAAPVSPNAAAPSPAAAQTVPSSSPTPTAAAAASATPPPPFVAPPGYALVPIGSLSQTQRDNDADAEERERERAQEREEEIMNAYEAGEPIPPGYRVVRESRRGLVIAGSIVGGLAYGFSIVGAVGADFEDKSAALMVPVAGPWIMLALGGGKDRACSASIDNRYDDAVLDACGDRAGVRAMLALDGLSQVAGAAMLAIGIAIPRTRLVRRTIQLSVAPMPFGRDGYGLSAIGRF